MEIHTTTKAKQDLENIWIYSFQKWGEKQADKYFDEIDYALHKVLLTNPKIGIACDHIRVGYRKYQINEHLVFYKLTSDKIRIIRFLHKNMDVLRHFS